MKNCEPLVFLPALAMERRPGLVCLWMKFSSRSRVRPTFGFVGFTKVLTCKLLSVDRLSTSSVPPREIATLYHELVNPE